MKAEMQKILQERISGCVLSDKDVLKFYSVDASMFQIIPEIVIVPKDENDVITAINIAKKFQSSVTVRGAGTGLVGSSLNCGIILDMKNLDSIKIEKNSVIVGPGTNKGKLDKMLRRQNKFFPPNPSVGRYCTIGGMLGNNSSGSKSLKYGSTIDNVLEVTFVDGNENTITLPQDKSVGEKVIKLAKKINANKIPAVTKNSSGYRLDQVIKKDDTHKFIIGAEGTLGIITSARLKIIDMPKDRILYVVTYESASDAAIDCPKILKSEPVAVEFVDSQTLTEFELGLEENVKCLLFVEYDTDLVNAEQKLRSVIIGKIIKIINTESEINQWWQMRDQSLYYSLKSIEPKDRFPHIIEDAVVPVENLVHLFEIIDKLNEKFKTKTITYGHAGNGNIHVRLLTDSQNNTKNKLIAKYYFERVINLGGSISGEHGDGLARTEFVKFQYGEKNYNVFVQLKNMFDPHDVLNPGKIITR